MLKFTNQSQAKIDKMISLTCFINPEFITDNLINKKSVVYEGYKS